MNDEHKKGEWCKTGCDKCKNSLGCGVSYLCPCHSTAVEATLYACCWEAKKQGIPCPNHSTPLNFVEEKCEEFDKKFPEDLHKVWSDGEFVGSAYSVPIKKEVITFLRTALNEAYERGRHSQSEEVRKLKDAIELILPLAKGYAAEHPVGSNQKYVEEVSDLSNPN